MRELIFLTLANHLPRLEIYDKIGCIVLRWAGLRIRRIRTIRGSVTIRPIGGAPAKFIKKIYADVANIVN